MIEYTSVNLILKMILDAIEKTENKPTKTKKIRGLVQ